MVPPQTLLDFLRSRDKFLILTHLSPDADGLGASIALAFALETLGKKTVLLDKDPVPRHCSFLPGQHRFHTFESFRAAGFAIQDFRNFVLVDCNSMHRVVGSRETLSARDFNGTVAVIDHHETERSFGDIRWIEPAAAATGLMVYYLVKALGVCITGEMAVNLYTAVSLDTGNFRYENTAPEVLRVAADLVEMGARPAVIYRELYESWSRGRFKLFVGVLETLEISDSVAITLVTRKMFDETGSSPEEVETFVSFPRIMRDIKVSALFRELDDNYFKVSLRSRDGIDVARVAEGFGGGGHKNAAGYTIRADIDTAKAEFLAQLKLLAPSRT